jgi:mannosyl-oligosaccharide glucosidase
MNLTYEIITSWFDQTDQESGWIAREQLLGRESRWPAPPSSYAQSSFDANPPSQHLLLDTLLNRFDEGEEGYDEFVEFLSGIYDNFKLNVEWFLKT